MSRLRFAFFAGTQKIMPARYLEDRRTRPGLETNPTIVQFSSDSSLVPGFVSVKLPKEREPRSFILGEVIDGKLRTTTYIETEMDLCAPGVVTLNSSIPFRIIRGTNTVHLHVPKGMGVLPAFIIAKNPVRRQWRHLVVGDLWRGEPWLHSVMEAPLPRPERPRRSRVS